MSRIMFETYSEYKSETPLVGGVKSRILSFIGFFNKSKKIDYDIK